MNSDTLPSRWPRVVGAIGLVVAVVMFVDKAEDIVTNLTWSAEDWRRVFAPDVADLIVRSMPPLGWRIFSAAAEMGLAVLLFVGAIALRRRRRSGVSLCRTWAWLAIVWVVAVMAWVLWWLSRYQGEIPGISHIAWQGFVVFGVVVAFVVLLAWPIFLLVWFGRPDIRAEWEEWPA
ncbi:MAG: hypothetical protein JSW43_13405 [Gemmatimonadota bacterium]|nr:MAG: hypothetical protein JSW43_13405 [Gemmatimonadota bacterium]